MSYATPDNIQDEFKKLDLSGGIMTTAKVQEYLDQTDQIINSYLGTLYIMPITGIISLGVVKKIEIDLVSSRIAKILQINKAVN